MTLQSMTGFARAEGSDETHDWVWEARSVNGKGLDIRCRLPAGYDELDVHARDVVGSRFRRGNISLTLSLDTSHKSSQLKINREALDAVLSVARQLVDTEALAAPSVDGLMRMPGILETDSSEDTETRAARVTAMGRSLDALLDMLTETRGREGKKLQTILEGLLGDISDGVSRAAAHEATQPDAIRDRLRGQIKELLDADMPLPEERLAQEIAMMTVKADVREELDRLRTHVDAFHTLLAGGEAPGRQLGFLCQELLREANTLCSKSVDSELTAIGLDLKVAIDRLREQVLNVE